MVVKVSDGGRVNQKKRAYVAIVEATKTLVRSGGDVTMAKVAETALVSEATVNRYFPDLISLMSEAVVELWPTTAEALEAVAHSDDPVERVAFATEFFLREMLRYEGASRAMLAVRVTHPEALARRSGIRFGLIAEALVPAQRTLGVTDPDAFARLSRNLAVLITADALFCLTDECNLDPEAAIADMVRMAKIVTEAAFEPDV